jgi:hypothetical protein
MPSLFGRDGAVPDAEEGAAIFRRTCVSAEFRAMAPCASLASDRNHFVTVLDTFDGVWRPRRWSYRDVLHGKFRADNDA